MSPTVRAASLRGFAPLIRELGGDPEAYLARFGIPADAIDVGDRPVSITAHDLMLETAAAELGCPDLGLRLAGGQDAGVLGPLALAIESSTTPRSAIAAASRFLFTHSPALSISIDDDPSGQSHLAAISYRKDLSQSQYSRQGIELGVGLMYRITALLVEDRIGVRSVDFPHAPAAPIARYLEFFGVDVRFNRPAPAIRAERRLLDRPLKNGNAAVRQMAVQFLADAFPDHPESRLSAQVRLALRQSLGSRPAIEHTARLLSVHPRTLQRRLAHEGTTFQTIRDEVRRDAAFALITTSDTPLEDVASAVGFTEPSTLTHAVHRWFDVSPRGLRDRSRPRLSR